MRRRVLRGVFVGIITVAIVAVAGAGARADDGSPDVSAKPDVRLVVHVVVDGLRYDTLHQFEERYAVDGFHRLLKSGTEYRQACYKHSNTFTASGHARVVSTREATVRAPRPYLPRG